MTYNLFSRSARSQSHMIKEGNGRQPDNISFLILIILSKSKAPKKLKLYWRPPSQVVCRPTFCTDIPITSSYRGDGRWSHGHRGHDYECNQDRHLYGPTRDETNTEFLRDEGQMDQDSNSPNSSVHTSNVNIGCAKNRSIGLEKLPKYSSLILIKSTTCDPRSANGG